MMEAQGDGVDLTWVRIKYAERLRNAPGEGARSAEVNAAELCDALRDSELIDVDTERWTITRRTHVSISENGKRNSHLLSPVAKGERDSPLSARSERQRGAVSASAAVQLRQLPDFHFEPFLLQDNPYIFDLIARRIGVPKEPSPWLVESLSTFRFTVDDLIGLFGLDGIKSAIEELNSAGEQCDSSKLLGQLMLDNHAGPTWQRLSEEG